MHEEGWPIMVKQQTALEDTLNKAVRVDTREVFPELNTTKARLGVTRSKPCPVLQQLAQYLRSMPNRPRCPKLPGFPAPFSIMATAKERVRPRLKAKGEPFTKQ